MKLLRFGELGAEKPGLLDADGQIRDLSSRINDITGATLSPAALENMRGLDPNDLPIVAGQPRIGACVGAVGKLIAIGLNYADHAAEANMARPAMADLRNIYNATVTREAGFVAYDSVGRIGFS